jgi:S1-C subfamily serine protease
MVNKRIKSVYLTLFAILFAMFGDIKVTRADEDLIWLYANKDSDFLIDGNKLPCHSDCSDREGRFLISKETRHIVTCNPKDKNFTPQKVNVDSFDPKSQVGCHFEDPYGPAEHFSPTFSDEEDLKPPTTIEAQLLSVVKITRGKKHGTGVVIGRDGNVILILTAYHIVKDSSDKITVTFKQKSYEDISAKLFEKTAESHDLALILVDLPSKGDNSSIDPPEITAAKTPVEVMMQVFVMGNPERAPWSVVSNKVSSKATDLHEDQFTIPDSGIAPQSSGSPVFDKNGEMVGIITNLSSAEERSTVSNGEFQFRSMAIALKVLTIKMIVCDQWNISRAWMCKQ